MCRGVDLPGMRACGETPARPFAPGGRGDSSLATLSGGKELKEGGGRKVHRANPFHQSQPIQPRVSIESIQRVEANSVNPSNAFNSPDSSNRGNTAGPSSPSSPANPSNPSSRSRPCNGSLLSASFFDVFCQPRMKGPARFNAFVQRLRLCPASFFEVNAFAPRRFSTSV